jgi:hypothetical protein
VIEVEAEQLSAGYTHVSLDATDPANANAQYGGCLYILRDLQIKGTPANLPQTLQ